MVSQTLAEGPFFDTTGENCGFGQTGEVWFLSFTLGGPVFRECQIPAGQMIFVPIIGAIPWAPEDCPDLETCRSMATELMDSVETLEAEIDGVPLSDLAQYRAQQVFAIELAEGTIFTDFGYTPGTKDPAVADGYYLMIAPLSRGYHEIHIRALIPPLEFESDVTYLLHVGPPAG
jgi:hypothetical protein